MDAYTYVDLTELNNKHIDQYIYVSGRVHRSKKTGSRGFIILREGLVTLQCIASKKDLENFKELFLIPNESFVAIYGVLSKLPDDIAQVEATYYHDFELKVTNYKVISEAKELPFTIDDATFIQKHEERNAVHLSTRLDSRAFDLRTPINLSLFRMHSKMSQLFREFLLKDDFIEINTPKLIGTASEGGANFFKVKYFEKDAFLAQSPQLYKQMCINSGFNKVFEIGPVFRAENSVSHRHLCEFTGYDVEMTIPIDKDYYHVVNTLWGVLINIFDGLKLNKEDYENIQKYHKFEEIICPNDPLIINFKDGVKMLQDAGFKQEELEDLNTENERELGKIVKEKFGSDMFVLDKYPKSARPFYTMPADDENYTNSYDVILRGEEICSGSQRQHDHLKLLDAITKLGFKPELLKDYLDSFKWGSQPHGGFGLGAARILMLYFDIGNVRRTTLYPRDPSRLTP